MIDNKRIYVISEELLRSLEKLPIGEATMESISRLVKIRTVKNRESLVLPGQYCNHVYLILEGAFIMRYFDEFREEGRTVYFYLDDMHPVMTCTDSFFTNQVTRCELMAVKKSKIAVLRKVDLDKLVEEDENVLRLYNHLLINSLINQDAFRLKLISYTKEDMYNHLLLHYPEIIKKIPSRYIAEFIGITPEWLAKLKKRLSQ